MTFLTNEQVAMFENAIKNHDPNLPELIKIVEEKMKEGIIEMIEEKFAQAPLVNVASKDDILKAVEKCENMSK